MNAVVNGFVAVLLWGFVRETLPIEEQKPLTLKDCTPLTSILQVPSLHLTGARLLCPPPTSYGVYLLCTALLLLVYSHGLILMG